MDIPIEIGFLPVVAVKDDRLTQTQGHGSFSIFSITLLFSLAIDEYFRALDHQAFDKTLIFVALGRTQRRIEVAQMQRCKERILEDLVASISHISEVLSASHARR